MSSEPIIAIGASAGGVEALSELVAGLPSDFGAPIVIVLHIPAEPPSLLPRILARRSKLPVVTAEEGMRAEPGRIYVAPPDRHVLVEKDGTLRTPRGPRENSHRPAVDPLFRSAALAYGSRAIGVVLTGTRDDGTSGLNAIKQCGGTAIVQDPADAAFPSMPKSALDHVKVDHAVPLRELPQLLVRVLAQRTESKAAGSSDVGQIEQEKGIAEMTPESLQDDDRPGKPSAFSCPDCGGVLWEIEESDLVRYRCRVGHAFSPESMNGAVDEALETALWSALKTLEESARLSKRLAENEAKRGQDWLVERFRARELEARNRAEVIRRFLCEEQQEAK
jgi:two-component system, chemotaxis family, protein-glutamate methylesterase/glutaminase